MMRDRDPDVPAAAAREHFRRRREDVDEVLPDGHLGRRCRAAGMWPYAFHLVRGFDRTARRMRTPPVRITSPPAACGSAASPRGILRVSAADATRTATDPMTAFARVPARSRRPARWPPRSVRQVPESEYAQRRAALAARLPENAVLLALGAREPREDFMTFVQTPRFWYLTGYLEPDAALLVVKRGGEVATTLFVLPRDPAREAWTGARLGAEGAAQAHRHARPPRHRAAAPRSTARSPARRRSTPSPTSTRAPTSAPTTSTSPRSSAAIPGSSSSNLAEDVDSLRSRHSAAELALLKQAIDITVDAQRAALGLIAPGKNEYEVQAIIEYTFREAGAERPGFATIAGSGPNATSLHYSANDRPMAAGDLIVMDIGASWRGYTADVTRTAPVSGTFTTEQRALYQVVRDAQAAAERQAKLGASPLAMDDSANAALTAGLARARPHRRSGRGVRRAERAAAAGGSRTAARSSRSTTITASATGSASRCTTRPCGTTGRTRSSRAPRSRSNRGSTSARTSSTSSPTRRGTAR